VKNEEHYHQTFHQCNEQQRHKAVGEISHNIHKFFNSALRRETIQNLLYFLSSFCPLAFNFGFFTNLISTTLDLHQKVE